MASRIALIGGALFFLLWAWAGHAVHVATPGFETLPVYFYRLQDLPLLIGYGLALAALLPFSGAMTGGGRSAPHRLPALEQMWIAAAILCVAIIARLGRDLVFHGYAPSRDEAMVEMAAAYLADGRIGWSVPEQWQPYVRAMQPEFYSPYGAGQTWTSIYLPVHAAIRAMFLRLGDADLAGPAMLVAGLVALWDVARRVMPGRRDAQAVTMAMFGPLKP